MDRFLRIIIVIGLVLSSTMYPIFSDDPGTNVVGTTATGALIGGIAGGGRGAGYGAAAGLGIGLLSSAARRTPEQRERERMNRQAGNEYQLNTLYDQHDALIAENNNLVTQVTAAGLDAQPFKSSIQKGTFNSTEGEINAVKREIKHLKKENRSLKKKVKRK